MAPLDDDARTHEFADRVRRYRGERGWTQVELARKAGLSRGTVSRIELGDERPLGRTAAALASALGVEVERLLGSLGQGALFPTPDEMRMDLVRRIVALPDGRVEAAYLGVRRALETSAAPPARRRRKEKGAG